MRCNYKPPSYATLRPSLWSAYSSLQQNLLTCTFIWTYFLYCQEVVFQCSLPCPSFRLVPLGGEGEDTLKNNQSLTSRTSKNQAPRKGKGRNVYLTRPFLRAQSLRGLYSKF